MKNFKYVLFIGMLLFAISSCKEDQQGPEGASAGAPKPITNPAVENLPGAAKITYALPDNRDLLYVRAVFTRSGKEVEVKSSLYNNFVELQGFGDTETHDVKLYAVNRYEESSEPVNVTVKPLEPPVKTIGRSLETQADFSGMNFTFENLTEAEVSIHVLVKNTQGEWVPAQDMGSTPSVLYTKRKDGIYAVRGFEPVSRPFAVYVKDRWDNHSDTLKVDITPIPEEELDRDCTGCFDAQTGTASDATAIGGWGLDKLFDNVFNDPTYHTATSSIVPQHVTFKVGPRPTIISRFKMWQRFGNEYSHANARKFELWGATTFSDDWTGWVLLGTFESIRPSGLPVGAVNTTEDNAYARAGEEFVLPPGSPAVSFLRFRTTETWGRMPYVSINELRFWGNPQ